MSLDPIDPLEPMPRRPSEPGPSEKQAGYRALLAGRIAVAAIVVVVFCLLGMTAYTVLLSRQTQQANTPTLKNAATAAKAAKDSADRIADCTTPGRSCYMRGQRQTAAAVGDISKANALAAAAAASCAKDNPDATFAEVYKCTVNIVDGTTPTPKRR